MVSKEEVELNGMFVEIQLFKNDFFGYSISGLAHDTYVIKIDDKDWETFKKKVADYFLGGVE